MLIHSVRGPRRRPALIATLPFTLRTHRKPQLRPQSRLPLTHAATNMNETSSRSHCIVTVRVTRTLQDGTVQVGGPAGG